MRSFLLIAVVVTLNISFTNKSQATVQTKPQIQSYYPIIADLGRPCDNALAARSYGYVQTLNYNQVGEEGGYKPYYQYLSLRVRISRFYTIRDRRKHLLASKWSPPEVLAIENNSYPQVVQQQIDKIFDYWQENFFSKQKVQPLRDNEATLSPRRSIISSISLAGEFLAAIRLYDGSEKPKAVDIKGQVFDSDQDDQFRLPLERRFNIKIPERLDSNALIFELGMLTSRQAVKDGIPILLFKMAEYISLIYGRGNIEEVDTHLQTFRNKRSTISVGGLTNVYIGDQIHSENKRDPFVKLYRKNVQPHLTLDDERIKGGVIYAVANNKLAPVHQERFGFEFVEQIDDTMQLLKLNLADFLTRFYFERKALLPEVSEGIFSEDFLQEALKLKQQAEEQNAEQRNINLERARRFLNNRTEQ